MKREEVFEEIYGGINTKLSNGTLNPYGATILSFIPSYEQDEFPLIVLSQVEYSLNSETLNKSEKKHNLSVEAQIFAKDTATVNKRIIANSVADLVEVVLQDDYGLRLELSNVLPNLDENVYRVLLRFSCIIDDDSKVIYRE